jgi:hypothetical protein
MRIVPKLGWFNGLGAETSFEVRTVYELLDVVRQKSGLFIGDPSLSALSGFLDGFRRALTAVGNSFDEEEPPFLEFNDWVAVRYGFHQSTAGWKNMLVQSLGDEAMAHERFFTELDEFRRAKR